MWFRTLFDACLARSSRTPVSRIRRVPRVRPLLEILEDRTLLSTYTVNVLTDTGAGSGLTGDLRYCLTNATSGSDIITFAQGLTGTINISEKTPLPSLNASVAIQGPGANQINVSATTSATTLSSFALFSVGMGAYVQISGLTIEDSSSGDTIDNSGKLLLNNCTFSHVGSITNGVSGSATVSNSTFSATNGINNSGTLTVSDSTFYQGGAIQNFVGGSATVSYSTLSDGFQAISNTGTLTINNSTISGNRAYGLNAYYYLSGTYSTLHFSPATNGMGGGIYMAGGTLSINSSTIADNEVIPGSTNFDGGNAGNGYGGGLYIAGGTVTINNSTFAGNQAASGTSHSGYGYPGVGYGGGIYNAAGPGALQMHDTILGANTADVGADLNGSVTSQGHNLIGNSSGGSGFVASDQLNVNPQLGPLQNNGGPTQTMALVPGSPAVNAGDNTSAPAYDQRGPGFPRIVGGTIDIGAYEASSDTLAVSGFPSTITAGVSQNFTVTALKPDGTTDTSYTGTVHFTSSDPKATLPADAALSNGTGQFSTTLETAGYQSITATDTSGSAGTGFEGGINVVPAAASSLKVAGFPSSATSGATGSFFVYAYDAYGNRTTDYNGTVHFTSSDPLAVLPADTTLSSGSGVFRATLKTVGYQSITATDTQTPSITGSQTGIQVLPVATITGPSAGAINQTLRFTLGAGSAPAGANFTFNVYWGTGNNSDNQTITGPSGTTVSYSYPTSGWYSIRVIATYHDANGNSFTSNPIYQSVNIVPVSVTIKTDPANTSRQMLVIDGTANSDSIVLAGNGNDVGLSFDGTPLGDILPTNGNPFALVVVYDQGSNDTIDARSLAVSSVLEGGGNGAVLYGGSARNLLIAGPGTATLYAGSAGDILIGGHTSYDNNVTALAYIMAEWDSADSYTTRVNKIKNGGGLNGSYVLNSTTVFDNNATDLLYGGAGMDWFFAHKKGKTADKVYGQTGGEVITSI